MKDIKRTAFLLFCAAILFSSLGCGGTDEGPAPAVAAYDGPPVEGDWLMAAMPSEPMTLNFVWGSDVYSTEVGRYVGDSLLDYDKNLNVIPRLGESWQWSADNLELTVKLREGVRWHDGTPFTARDVKFCYEKIMDPKSKADNKIAAFEKVKSVEALDDRTVRIRYKEPLAAALALLADNAGFFVPKHIFEKEDWFKSDYNNKPIGTGPYKMVEWVRGSHIIVERNDDYWGTKPFLKRIVWKIIKEDTVRFQALRSGETDYASMKPDQWVTEATAPEFESRFNKHLYFVSYFWYIGWNMDGSNPFFADRRVRQAMALAFDRAKLNEKVFYGLWKVASTSLHPDSWAHNPNVAPWPYEPERAKALLEEAGWRDTDGDGVRDKGGKPFSFTLLMPVPNETATQLGVRLKEELRKIGVSMEIQGLEWAAFIERVQSKKFEAQIMGWRLGIDPADEYDLWHTSQWPDGVNYGKFSNPEVDDLLDRARREFDREKRKAMYWRAQEVVAEEQPYLFLYYPATLFAVDKRIRGLEISPKGIANFHPGYAAWWVPPAEQRYGK